MAWFRHGIFFTLLVLPLDYFPKQDKNTSLSVNKYVLHYLMPLQASP